MSRKDEYIKSVNKIKASDKMKEEIWNKIKSQEKQEGWRQVKVQGEQEYNWARRLRISSSCSYSDSSHGYSVNYKFK